MEVTEKLREGFHGIQAADNMNSDHPAACCKSLIDHSNEGPSTCAERGVNLQGPIDSLLNVPEKYIIKARRADLTELVIAMN